MIVYPSGRGTGFSQYERRIDDRFSVLKGYGLQPVRKTRKAYRALAPEGMPVCLPQLLKDADNGLTPRDTRLAFSGNRVRTICRRNRISPQFFLGNLS